MLMDYDHNMENYLGLMMFTYYLVIHSVLVIMGCLFVFLPGSSIPP